MTPEPETEDEKIVDEAVLRYVRRYQNERQVLRSGKLSCRGRCSPGQAARIASEMYNQLLDEVHVDMYAMDYDVNSLKHFI